MRPLEEEMLRMIPVVERVAAKFARGSSLDLEECLGVGMLNMVQSVKAWKEGKASLEAWVGMCARRAMLNELRDGKRARAEGGGKRAIWREEEKKRQMGLPHVGWKEEEGERVKEVMKVVGGRARKGEEMQEMVGLLARGLKGREVEEVMGTNRSTVRSRMYMIRKALGG